MSIRSQYSLAALTFALALGMSSGVMAAPATSAMTHAQDDRATAALNLMEAHDYSNFRDFKADGQKFTAIATLDNGKTIHLEIDPDNGRIVTASLSD